MGRARGGRGGEACGRGACASTAFFAMLSSIEKRPKPSFKPPSALHATTPLAGKDDGLTHASKLKVVCSRCRLGEFLICSGGDRGR